MPEIELHLVLFGVAIFAGFIGAIVGGNGLITLPALLLCGIPPHLSLATNKLQNTCGLCTAALIYAKRHTMPHVAFGVLCAAAGGGLGAYTALLVAAAHLKIVILACLVASFFYMLIHPKLGNAKTPPKIKNIKTFYISVAFILGFYDGFVGPGTGSFLIFAAVTLLGYDLKSATINTKLLNFASNITALVVFLCLYKALWSVGILMAMGQIIGAYFGAKCVLKKDNHFIRNLFLIVVAATILKLIWDYF